MTDPTPPRKPSPRGLLSPLFALDPDPESKPRHERRHGPYRPKPTSTDDALGPWEFMGVIVMCIGGLLLVSLLAGCVTTELTSAGVTISRTSILSDVELEASIGPNGEMAIRERQGQAVAEGVAGTLSGGAP